MDLIASLRENRVAIEHKIGRADEIVPRLQSLDATELVSLLERRSTNRCGDVNRGRSSLVCDRRGHVGMALVVEELRTLFENIRHRIAH
jgi:hypothetical protein